MMIVWLFCQGEEKWFICLHFNQEDFHHLCNSMLSWSTIPWT